MTPPKDDEDKNSCKKGIQCGEIKDFQFPKHQISNNCTVKKKEQPQIDTRKCKIDTGSDGNFMPIRMYKIHFIHTNDHKVIKRNSLTKK